MVRLVCKCGALYEVTTHRAAFGHTGVAACEVCRIVMDRWDGVTIYETYVLVQRNDDRRDT